MSEPFGLKPRRPQGLGTGSAARPAWLPPLFLGFYEEMQLGDGGVAQLAKELAKALHSVGSAKGSGKGDGWRARSSNGAWGKSSGGSGRPGDWVCKAGGCGYNNFASRHVCRACGGRGGGQSGTNQRAHGRDTSVSPTSRAATLGKGSSKGGNNSAIVPGKSFAAAIRSPTPARLHEFIRQPGGKGAGKCKQEEGRPPNTAGSNRPTWFDLSADDAETLVAEGKAEETVAGQQDEPRGSDNADSVPTTEPPAPDRATLQQKIKHCKRVISLLGKEGCGEGDDEYDGAQRRLERLTQQLGEKDDAGGLATGSALDRAERQLKKANAARDALDLERANLEEEHQRNLAKLNARYEQVDARILLHTKKIKDIKSAIGGGGSRVPKKVERNVAAATEILNAVGPSIAGALAMLKPDPRCQGEQGTLDNLGEQLGKVYQHLLATTDAIEAAVVESSSSSDESDEESSEFDDDLDDDDEFDEDEMEITTQTQQVDSTVQGTQHAEQGDGSDGNIQRPMPSETEQQHPAPQPTAPADAGADTPLQATPMEQVETATSGAEATETGSRSCDGPTAKKPKHHKSHHTGKEVIRDGKDKNNARKLGAVGGATAPMLAAAQGTSSTA